MTRKKSPPAQTALGDVEQLKKPGVLSAASAADLRQLSKLVKSVAGRDPFTCGAEPVRSIHHLSCAGGTLFSKCIASMANTLVLNEVDPLSRMESRPGQAPKFTPTDVIALMRQGDPDISPDLIERLFVRDLEFLREELWKTGRTLVLRDHTHSHFLFGDYDARRLTIREIVQAHFPVLSVVTVRDPVDSYVSMAAKGWHRDMTDPSFENYCRRYLWFLDRYAGVPVIKYEALVADPQACLKEMCDLLALEYFPGFEQVFSAFQLSGDSGRGGHHIVQHPSRDVPDAIRYEIETSSSYKSLIGKLNYSERE